MLDPPPPSQADRISAIFEARRWHQAHRANQRLLDLEISRTRAFQSRMRHLDRLDPSLPSSKAIGETPTP